MPRRKGRGRAILAAGARTLGRGLFRAVRRSDKAAHWARVGEDWFETLGELKGAAMKLGQIASQYSDLLPPEIAAQLARLQESAQPHPWDEMRGLLDWHWTDEQRALVESVEPEPLASASIGQVHRGRLADGREVAIKIQYEGVAAAVDADVRNLGRMLKLAGVLPIDGDSLDALLVEVRERMREEVDYALERRHIEQFRALPDIEGIVYPTPCRRCALSACWSWNTRPAGRWRRRANCPKPRATASASSSWTGSWRRFSTTACCTPTRTPAISASPTTAR